MNSETRTAGFQALTSQNLATARTISRKETSPPANTAVSGHRAAEAYDGMPPLLSLFGALPGATGVTGRVVLLRLYSVLHLSDSRDRIGIDDHHDGIAVAIMGTNEE